MITTITKRINTYNFEFEFDLTCTASPEQYDVTLEGKQVGYVRLRWGFLRCDYPNIGGETIYEYAFTDGWQGCFNDDYQRNNHLDLIAKALYNRILESETVR